MVDGYLFLSDWLDLALVTSTFMLLVMFFIMVLVLKHLTKEREHLAEQVEYWRQQALSEQHRDEEN
tara:strand:- start:6 stop:203 length:198 start_codon:yes stop_codon:yes gene_type:complete